MATTTETKTESMADGVTITTTTTITRPISTATQHAAQRDKIGGPIAEQRPHRVPFGHVEGETRAGQGHTAINPPLYRDDPWFWLRDDTRKSEEILEHLKKENEYGKSTTASLDPHREVLYAEHKSHLKETDDTPPYPFGKFLYYTRTVEGKSYGIHCRREGSQIDGKLVFAEGSAEEILLDVNILAEGTTHCDIRGVKPSPDHTRLVYSADFSGNETYEIVVLDIATGEKLESDPVDGVAGTATWSGNNASLFYVTEDEAKRPWKVWRHKVGEPQSQDTLLCTESDEQYNIGIGKTMSGKYLFIHCESSETTEASFIDLSNDDSPAVVVQPREFGLRYYPDHHGDNFLIVTNKGGATEMQLMLTPIGSPGQTHWTPVLPPSKSRFIEGIECFEKYVAVEGREGGLTQVWIMDASTVNGPDPDTLRKLIFKDDLYETGLSTNMIWSTDQLRVHYSSLASPLTWYNFDMSGRQTDANDCLTLVKAKEVLNFDGSFYSTRRVSAVAPDGTDIPISMFYRTDVFPDGIPAGTSAPMMLYGYGSYGICIDPGFDARLLPYVDRGMIYAIAHVRGGGEMGRFWFEEQGKYLNKRNTFTDFIACAEFLVEHKYTVPSTLAIEGRSAGGLLMGAVLNMRPDLFNVAVAGVPFVDVMNTMSDPSIPLTTGEWEEWGNPNEHKYFDYMLSYSPYDNVREQAYPNILITAGLHDPRVAYWEPLKWASKLRSLKIDSNEVICKYDLESGHFSASDRYKYLREKAWEQAYVLDKIGLGHAALIPYPE